MFIDHAKIFIKAGNGGNGKVSFHREKYVAAGGPDGGDGGRGGNIVFTADDNLSTLMDFRYKKKYAADNGEEGGGKNRFGRDGQDLVIKVPRGTVIKDAETGAIMWDMACGDDFIAARGGNGGWGNKHFATPTRQAPRFAKAGLDGEQREVILELKLLADVGLVGFPNVGKSTILSVMSAARPKIADYHFTTLTPNLGMVYMGEGNSFVMADIPGLIEGAADGAGLGHNFLRHIERCRMLVHVVDVSGSEGRNPIDDFNTIQTELEKFSPKLAKLPQIIAANKSDLITDEVAAREFRNYIKEKNLTVVEISAVQASGMDKLRSAIWEMLSQIPTAETFKPEFLPQEKQMLNEDVNVTFRDGVFFVESELIEYLFSSVNVDDYESRMYFERELERRGVYNALREAGVKDGDTVNIYGMEFEFVE